MVYSVKSNQVKQWDNNLESYRRFTEDKLKLFIRKEFDRCGSLPLLLKIMLEGEMYHFLTQLTSTVEEGNRLVVYSRTFLPVWYRAGVVYTECLTDFWYPLDRFHSWFIHFSWIEHSLETIKAIKPFAFITLSWNRHEMDI